MNDYVSKPVNPATLVHTIMRYIDAALEPVVIVAPVAAQLPGSGAILEAAPLQAIDRGLADAAAGRVRPLTTVLAAIDAKLTASEG